MVHTLRHLLFALLLAALAAPAIAQEEPVSEPSEPIAAERTISDSAIAARLSDIFSEIRGLEDIVIEVNAGVVSLSGTVSQQGDGVRAVAIASRLEGVVTVEDAVERSLAVETSLSPAIANLENSLRRGWEALPLIGLALAVFIIIWIVGHLLASWKFLWKRLAPNPFLVEIIAQAIRFIALIVGLVVALNLVGATALMGAILGGAGVIGLAIGFAVRDTVENYISSIMLSLRQPFRANDHVLINEHEGKVVRLTSRATILMTLDGNHLRIPNSTVFKAIILNYTRNPERRFEFELGVDANDDPVAAMACGFAAMGALDFILREPKPDAHIKAVGDSNIVIRFMGWLNQSEAEFHKARSLAIRATKDALEEDGFTLPEPIYRLRFDGNVPALLTEAASDASAKPSAQPAPTRIPSASDVEAEAQLLDVRPDDHITEKVDEERAATGEEDLLDNERPVE
ncbi:mechanosensitive ion channel domain-containing protein [Henriciella sp. AS95]|uniref:mechanosensitive ion channel domain-containing protein n=1 Tax=Henriciella sp. AS95 TaxID=3135782 RepID=UPI00316EF046